MVMRIMRMIRRTIRRMMMMRIGENLFMMKEEAMDTVCC